MGILDQKSDLSKYRNFYPKTDVTKQSGTETISIDRNFGSKQPLDSLLKATPGLSVNPTTPKKQGKDVDNLSATPEKPGKEVTNTSTQLGRHTTSNIQLQPTTKIFERVGKTVDSLAPTPEKTINITNPVTPTPSKPGKVVNLLSPTPNKPGRSVDILPPTPNKTTVIPGLNPVIPIKQGVSVNPLATAPVKTTPTLGLVDYFDNFNAGGFTSNISSTQYNIITGTPGNLKFNSPILNTQLGLVDYFDNAHATGFTSNVSSIELGQYKTITGQIGNLQFNSPRLNTQLKNYEIFSSVASGFTPNMGLLTTDEKSQFKGIENGKFDYPNIIEGGKSKRLMNVPRTNTKFSGYAGIGSLDNQLGNGSPFTSLSGANTSQPSIGPFLTKGGEGNYNETSPYFPAGVQSIERLGNRYTIGSTPLDGLYNQFSLRDESYNSTPIKQPYIIRGIQRAGKSKNQRWGLGNFYASADAGELPNGTAGAVSYLEALDGGFIRGGISTALDRAVHDLGRIAKFQISPQGLTFAAKQFGLQMSNPGVEQPLVGGYPVQTRMTRMWTPLNMLANVAGNAFGLHFKRHGILPVGEGIFDYEKVVKQRNNKTDNRIIKLRDELIDPNNSPVNNAISSFRSALGIEGQEIQTLSNTNVIKGAPGIAGPGSVYGLGKTSYLRAVNSQKDPVRGDLSANITPGSGIPAPTPTLPPIQSAPIGHSLPASNNNKLKDYAVLSYGKLKNGSDNFNNRVKDYNDFREDIIEDKDGTTFIGNLTDKKGGSDTPYSTNNLVKKFGVPNSGKTGVDRSNFTKSTGLNDKVNAYDFQEMKLSDLNTKAEELGFKDLIKFWFTGPNMLSMDSGKDKVMLFRATLTGFTDTFNGEWSSNKMIGRGDPVHTYQGFNRSVSFSFRVAATSRDEMKPIWRKLNYLASYTAPDYTPGGRMKSPFIRLTIGDLFNNTPGLLTSVTFTVPDNSPWEINLEDDKNMQQVPHMVDVQISFTPVLDYRPQLHGRMYSLSPNGSDIGVEAEEGNWLADNIGHISQKDLDDAAAAEASAKAKAKQAEQNRKAEEQRNKKGTAEVVFEADKERNRSSRFYRPL